MWTWRLSTKNIPTTKKEPFSMKYWSLKESPCWSMCVWILLTELINVKLKTKLNFIYIYKSLTTNNKILVWRSSKEVRWLKTKFFQKNWFMKYQKWIKIGVCLLSSFICISSLFICNESCLIETHRTLRLSCFSIWRRWHLLQ